MRSEILISAKCPEWAVYRILLQTMAAPKSLKVSEWADEERKLPPEAAEPGRWYTERAEYQRAILDAFSDPLIEKVVVMTSAQVGKALSIDTPIPTPCGWSNIKDISVGDTIFAGDGK